MAKRKRPTECAYCGEVTFSTKDHVIPLCLFTKPYPANLITVNACNRCNGIKSEDDDYLRDLLTSDIYGIQHPAAQEIFLSNVIKSARRNSSDIAKAAARQSNYEAIYTQGGIYLGHGVSVPIDGERTRHIFSRIVRGLYYDARKQRLPADYNFEIRRIDAWNFNSVAEAYFKMHPNGPRILEDIFGCMFLSANEDAYTTLWLLWFYNRIVFSVAAIKPELSMELEK